MKHGQRRFTVLLIRGGAARSRRIELGNWRTRVVVGTGLLTCALAFIMVGYWSGRASRDAVLAKHEKRIVALTEENARVAGLAAQLAGLEGEYEQMRRVMGGRVARAKRDIALPELAPGTSATGQTVASSVPSMWPLIAQGFVTRSFGDTLSAPFEGHVGLDIAVPIGSYVRASGAGIVRNAGEDDAYGQYVRIGHAEGISSLYAHNSWLFVAEGDSVERGEVIALSGNTGRSTAPHLHFEIDRNGEPMDPVSFVGGG